MVHLGAFSPPVLLVHGAANSAGIWTYWQGELASNGWATAAVNLRGHGPGSTEDLSDVSMDGYVSDVREVATAFWSKPVVMGWSMGGLIAMMLAARGEAAACVALAPSMPALTEDPQVPLDPGVFGAEEYGITSTDPENQPGMPDLDLEERRIALASLGPESQFARSERRRGIVITGLPCPLLLITGSLDTQWPLEAYEGLWLPHDRITMEASHWGLVLNRRAIGRALPDLLRWLQKATGGTES